MGLLIRTDESVEIGFSETWRREGGKGLLKVPKSKKSTTTASYRS